MPCGISFRDPEADTAADLSKVIKVGRGPMTAKNVKLKLKVFSSYFCIFLCFKDLPCLVYF